MKTIGILGGTGWVSTVDYYTLLNQTVNRRLGEMQYARCIIYSLNFAELMERKNDPRAMVIFLEDAANRLIAAGAECLMLGANTLHMFADKIEKDLPVPLIHIARSTAAGVKKTGFTRVGLLGTKQTMEKSFYKTILNHEGIEVIIPEAEDRNFIDHTILNDFFKEIFTEETRQKYLRIIGSLKVQGAQGIILGCTEIPLLIKQEHCDIPLFNTTKIHVEAAVEFALQ